MLSSNAPPEYADRETLWNAVEAVENQWKHHIMDEAEERGKQIAKALEKSEPKTEEERKEEQREEAEEVTEELAENTAEQAFDYSDMETENLIEENEIERMQMRFDVRA
jgi:DNA-directed RNA polymerase beta' subunit